MAQVASSLPSSLTDRVKDKLIQRYFKWESENTHFYKFVENVLIICFNQAVFDPYTTKILKEKENEKDS